MPNLNTEAFKNILNDKLKKKNVLLKFRTRTITYLF